MSVAQWQAKAGSLVERQARSIFDKICQACDKAAEAGEYHVSYQMAPSDVGTQVAQATNKLLRNELPELRVLHEADNSHKWWISFLPAALEEKLVKRCKAWLIQAAEAKLDPEPMASAILEAAESRFARGLTV